MVGKLKESKKNKNEWNIQEDLDKMLKQQTSERMKHQREAPPLTL